LKEASAARQLEVSHAWLQKHPTPVAGGGEFHWYPGAGEGGGIDARLRGRVVEQVQGLTAPSVWWELAPGQVIWASVFSAISPGDSRPYRGVALCVVRGDAPAEALLARMVPAPPRPWQAEPPSITAAGEAEAHALSMRDAARLARAMLRGGAAAVSHPHQAALPARLAELMKLLPAEIAESPKSGQLRQAGEASQLGQLGPMSATGEADGGDERAGGGDALAELLARAWLAEGAARRSARAAWTLLCELGCADDELPEPAAPAACSTTGGAAAQRLDEILTASRAAEERAAAPEALLGWLEREERERWRHHHGAAPSSWARLLHGWGRGWLDDAAPGPAMIERLAHELALRALAAQCAGQGASAILAEARWHALLPSGKRRALMHALTRRAPCLSTDRFGPRPRRGSPVLHEESTDVA
jgi:hypothetical protein